MTQITNKDKKTTTGNDIIQDVMLCCYSVMNEQEGCSLDIKDSFYDVFDDLDAIEILMEVELRLNISINESNVTDKDTETIESFAQFMSSFYKA